MNENLITLYDEDGNEVPFEFLDYIEYDHCKYVALLPLAGDLENAEVLILQLVENESTGEAPEQALPAVPRRPQRRIQFPRLI